MVIVLLFIGDGIEGGNDMRGSSNSLASPFFSGFLLLFPLYACLCGGCGIAAEKTEPDMASIGAALTATEFYDAWKVQVNRGDGSYVNMSPSLEAEYISQYLPTLEYTSLVLTIWNEDEDLGGDRKPRVELRELDGSGNPASWSQAGSHQLTSAVKLEYNELNGWKRDIIVAQAHTDGNYDPKSDGSTDLFATGIYYRTSTGTLECKVSGSSGNSTSTLASNVAFGIYYYLRIEVKDAQSRCGIYSNSVWVYTPYATGHPGKMYYKTGNYTQPTQVTVGLAGRTRVRIKNFSVLH
jgi:Alginate lyase